MSPLFFSDHMLQCKILVYIPITIEKDNFKPRTKVGPSRNDSGKVFAQRNEGREEKGF